MRNVILYGENIDKISNGTVNDQSHAEKEQMRIMLSGAMDKALTVKQKKCLSMYYFDEMKMDKIANELGLNKSTVSRHIAAARKKLGTLKLFL